MELKRKNQKLLIIVGVLLLFGGISLAYFVSSTKINGSGALVDATTSEINGAVVKIEGILNFDDTNIYPGHKNVANVKLTATGDNELIPYNLIWSGTNTINTPLNYTVYKTSTEVNVNASCNKKTEVIGGMQVLSEECSISNLDSLGSSIASGTINKGDTKVTLVKDEFITAYSTSNKVYYYIVLEYPNLDKEQNEDINGVLNGKIKAEESSTKPDINIIAAYVKQDNGEYTKVNDIPQSGYVLNSSKSTCSNGAKPNWKDNGLFVSNLTKSGTSCYLYFDKQLTASETILANLGTNIKTTAPDFSQIADTDEGVYATSDGTNMYSGTTYYWRGAATTNHVIFANKCWRIVRINGDKTIRLIYNGEQASEGKCAEFGSGAVVYSSTESDRYYATSGGAYNNASYVGWTYSLGSQRTTGGTASNVKVQTEKWYSANIGNDTPYSSKVASGKFCNDRNMASGSSFPNGGTESTTQYYVGYERLNTNKTPTFNCSNLNDAYTLKVGAITADEVAFAGGVYETNNTSYYLKGDNNYWTMSPSSWNGGYARVFHVKSNGNLGRTYVYSTYGLRPVINLRSDVTFSSGDGTQNSPYIVEN